MFYSMRVNGKVFLHKAMVIHIGLNIVVFLFFMKLYFDFEKVVEVPLFLSKCLFVLMALLCCKQWKILMNMELDSRKEFVLIGTKD